MYAVQVMHVTKVPSCMRNVCCACLCALKRLRETERDREAERDCALSQMDQLYNPTGEVMNVEAAGSAGGDPAQ